MVTNYTFYYELLNCTVDDVAIDVAVDVDIDVDSDVDVIVLVAVAVDVAAAIDVDEAVDVAVAVDVNVDVDDVLMLVTVEQTMDIDPGCRTALSWVKEIEICWSYINDLDWSVK